MHQSVQTLRPFFLKLPCWLCPPSFCLVRVSGLSFNSSHCLPPPQTLSGRRCINSQSTVCATCLINDYYGCVRWPLCGCCFLVESVSSLPAGFQRAGTRFPTSSHLHSADWQHVMKYWHLLHEAGQEKKLYIYVFIYICKHTHTHTHTHPCMHVCPIASVVSDSLRPCGP